MAQQTIRFAHTRDGVRLAWAASGRGPALVKAATWLTHLEYDWESPVWRHWIHFFSDHFRVFRYDERGNGLSDHQVENLSADCWESDLATVIEAAEPERPFVLLGISQGAAPAVAYAVHHPEEVSHLIIYGGYSLGWKARKNSEAARRWRATIELTELGWGGSNPVFRRLYTTQFLPGGSEEQLSWFDELCARTTSASNAAKLMDARGEVDVESILEDVKVPTLVIHARQDAIVPFKEGVKIAGAIPGAEFMQVDSRNHILLSDEPAWDRFTEAVLDFTGRRSSAEDPVFAELSDRERDILGKLTEGGTNVEIGEALFISEKTVRNHITRIFEKLGVKTRAQAIVFARDHGFRN